jgi:hypothetical protein
MTISCIYASRLENAPLITKDIYVGASHASPAVRTLLSSRTHHPPHTSQIESFGPRFLDATICKTPTTGMDSVNGRNCTFGINARMGRWSLTTTSRVESLCFTQDTATLRHSWKATRFLCNNTGRPLSSKYVLTPFLRQREGDTVCPEVAMMTTGIVRQDSPFPHERFRSAYREVGNARNREVH